MEMTVDESSGRAAKVLAGLFGRCETPLAVRIGGETLTFGRGDPECTLVFKKIEPLRDLILHGDPVRLAQAYFRGNLDIEGSIYPAIRLKDELNGYSLEERIGLLFSALRLKDESGAGAPWEWRAFRRDGGDPIGFHYDVSDGFYRLWLDRRMVYSCAYFSSPGQSLEAAQVGKLDLVCRKLRLKPGERFLDIGCGWGALLQRAATHYGAIAHGVTLSRNQHRHVSRLIEENGLSGRVSVDLADYRDLDGEYDKIASVGMFEHVGLKRLPEYFSTVHRLLKSGGLFLNHGITHEGEGWEKCAETEFINRYVFPGGELDRVSNILGTMEDALFEIHDVESLRPHYALTLREWVRRLESRHDAALGHVSEGAFRVWRLYMAGSAMQFESGDLGVTQILAVKRRRGLPHLPLSRCDLVQPS